MVLKLFRLVRFCVSHFAVILWSSAQRNNIEPCLRAVLPEQMSAIHGLWCQDMCEVRHGAPKKKKKKKKEKKKKRKEEKQNKTLVAARGVFFFFFLGRFLVAILKT